MLLLWRNGGFSGCRLVSDFVQLVLLHKKLVGVEMQEFHDPAYTGETRMHNIPGDHSSCSGSQDNYTIPRAKGQSAGKKPSLLRAFLSSTLNPMGSKSELFYRLSFTCYAFDIQSIDKRSRYRHCAEWHILSVMIMRHEQFQRRQFFFF